MRSITFILLLAACGPLHAATEEGRNSIPLELTYARDVSRSHVSLGTEINQLKSNTGSALGFGPRAGFTYGLSSNWALASAIDFSFDTSGEAGAFLYSGLNGMIQYSILGSALLARTHVRDNGVDIVTATPNTKRRWSAMLGVEQLFLNGTANIYPAVGFLLGSAYTFGYAGREFQVDVRYTTMKANNNPLSMITIGFGINLTL